MLAALKSEQERCPLTINEHVTLERIEDIGRNHIKYFYTVSHKRYVTAKNRAKTEAEVIKRVNASPLAPWIKKLDLRMLHSYRTSNGLCALCVRMTRNNLTEPASATTTRREVAVEQKRQPPEKPWTPRQLKPAQRSSGNPVGIQLNPFVK